VFTARYKINVISSLGRTMADAIGRWPLTAKTRVSNTRSALVSFVVDKVALG
jgi:hypothetical protein